MSWNLKGMILLLDLRWTFVINIFKKGSIRSLQYLLSNYWNEWQLQYFQTSTCCSCFTATQCNNQNGSKQITGKKAQKERRQGGDRSALLSLAFKPARRTVISVVPLKSQTQSIKLAAGWTTCSTQSFKAKDISWCSLEVPIPLLEWRDAAYPQEFKQVEETRCPKYI